MRTSTKTLLVAFLASGLVWSCGKDEKKNDKKRVVISELGQSSSVPGTRIHPNVNQYIQPGNNVLPGLNRAVPNYQVARIPLKINSYGVPSIVPNQSVQYRGLNGWNQNVASIVQSNPAILFGGANQAIPGLGNVGQFAYQPQPFQGQGQGQGFNAFGVNPLCYLPNYQPYSQQAHGTPWGYLSQLCGYNQQASYSQEFLRRQEYRTFKRQLMQARYNSQYRHAVPHYGNANWKQFYRPYTSSVFGLNNGIGNGINGINGRFAGLPNHGFAGGINQAQVWQQAQALAASHAWGNTAYSSSFLSSVLPAHVTLPQARNGIYSVPFADGRVLSPQTPFSVGADNYLYMLQCRTGNCPLI